MTDEELEEMYQFEVEYDYSDLEKREKFWKEFDKRFYPLESLNKKGTK